MATIGVHAQVARHPSIEARTTTVPAPSVTVQLVVFHDDPVTVRRTVVAHARASEHGWRTGATSQYDVAIADCSPTPVLDEATLTAIRAETPSLGSVRYEFLGENLGHGAAQNVLAKDAQTELLVFSNPDVVPDTTAVASLARRLAEPTIGIAEAKQLPIEHPKAYDLRSGDTSWAAGAFMMVRRDDFARLGGFDRLFFLHGDDVDLSWRYRARGYRVVTQPSAVVFHDKRIRDHHLQQSGAERRHGLESALVIRRRWGTAAQVEHLLQQLLGSGDAVAIQAAEAFQARTGEAMPTPHPDAASVAEFHPDGNYAEHRYAL